MKICSTMLAATALLATASAQERSPTTRQLSMESSSPNFGSSSSDDSCLDPAGAVLALTQCVEAENVECVTESYDPAFQAIHNEIPVDDSFLVTTTDLWSTVFLAFDFSFDFKFSENAGANEASVRYVQTMTTTGGEPYGLAGYPFSQTLLQHEHVIVTVDNDCKMVKWDQYGDNKEQSDEGEVLNDLLCAIGMASDC